MKKFLTEKKWLVLSALAILVLALVIGIVAIAGGGEKEPNPTEGTSNVGDSTGTTGDNGNEVTDPSNPSDVTDSTGTPENPAQPDNPDKPDGYIEPTGPEPTLPEDVEIIIPSEDDDPEAPGAPTVPAPDSGFSGDSYVGNPEDGDQTVVEPNPTVPESDPEPTYDFTGFTAGNLTLELWNSWSREKQQAYLLTEPLNNATLDDKYNYACVTRYNGGYDCGFEGHYCLSEAGHNKVLAEMEEGCYYCGAKDCVSFYARDDVYGYTKTNFEKCPKYHNNCEVCGLPRGGYGKSGEMVCTKSLADGYPCPFCGADRKANECHNCIKP